jgi:hypothetical protein
MQTLVARGGDAVELLARDQHLVGGLVLILVVVLYAMAIREYLTAAIRPVAPPPLVAPVRLTGRLHAQRSGARRRAWTLQRRERRPLAMTVRDWVGTGRPSPAMLRLRARRATWKLSGNWAVVRYPR